jgi:hydroxymethylbilane synthase
MMAQESVPTCPTSCAKSSCPIDLNDNVQTIRVGSRKSKLALIQTDIVINLLKEQYGDSYSYSITSMTTIGDHILDQPLSQIGEKALFTRELEDALLDKKIDLIVHSLKDLPTTLPNGCCIGAILK